MSSAINRKRTSDIALSVQREHKFTRISKSFLDELEAEHIVNIHRKVKSLPSKGKTMK